MARTVPNKGYGGIYGEEAAGKAPRDVRASRAQKAANDFAGAEEAASREAPKVEDNTTSSSTDVAENGSAGHTPQYSGDSGASASKAGRTTVGGAMAKVTPMGRIAGGLKNAFKSGDGGSNRKPLFAIGGLTGIIAVFMMLISSMLPIHLLTNFGDLRNTLQTQNNGRTNTLIRRIVQGEDSGDLFGKRNKISTQRNAQINRGLEKAGMRFDVDPETNRYALFSVDADGNTTGRLASTEVELKNKFDTDATFRTAWNDGTKVMTGKNSGWFGSAMAFMLRGNNLTRNLFKNFIADSDAGSALEQAQTRLSESESRTLNSQDIAGATRDTTIDDDGAEVGKTTPTDTPRNKANFDNIKARIDNDIRVKAGQLAGGIATGYCAIKLAVAAVSAVYAMEEAIRGISVVAGYFEAGQKPLAGEGDDSYHAFGDMLNTSTATKTYDEAGSESDELGNYDVEHGGVKLSPTESRGLQAVLVGGITASSGSSDMSVMKYSAEKATQHISMAAGEVRNCTVAIIGASLVNIGIFAAQVIVGIATLGIGAALIEVGKIAAREVVEGLMTQGVMGLALKQVIPMIAIGAITAVATEVWGEDFGNMIGSFGSRYFSKAHQGSGGPATSYDNALAFYREQQTVLAYNAELDRATHSPFDTANSNTFLGKISSNFAVASAGSSASLLGQIDVLGGFASAMRLPVNVNAAATQEIEFNNTINWNWANDENGCERLTTIGAVGDMFCNPIRSNDMSTATVDPEVVFWKTATSCDGKTCSFEYDVVEDEDLYRKQVALAGRETEENILKESCDRNGNCTYYAMELTEGSDGLEQIDPKSDLAKMIKYGVNRKTDPGITDANILQEESQVSTGSGFWDSLLGAIPVVGEAMDMVEALNRNGALEKGWVTGEAFCAGCNFSKWESDYKYLDQYIVDNNIYENMGAIEKSPVVAYMEEEILPNEDNSYEGILAANLGMPREWVISTLAFAEDLKSSPQDAYALIASSPNIYSTYYGGQNYNDMNIREEDNPCEALGFMRECTQIAGTELRRRFNAEAVA